MGEDLALVLAPDLATEVDRFVKESGLSYLDAVLAWCEVNGIEEESAADIIKKNPALRARLQVEAEELHFLKSSSRLMI